MINSALIIDDDLTHARQISEYFVNRGVARAVPTRHPSQGISMALEESFDIVLIDITIGYRGNPFGGLEIYRQLRRRYGKSALLAYSQYLDDHVLERFGESLNFIERDYSINGWELDLFQESVKLRKQQTCFIAIPFADSFNSINSSIVQAIIKSQYRPVRIDERIFTESIVDRIFGEIYDARFLVMVADGKNPNVFLEGGYAMALTKQVISVADSSSDLPFDIQSKNCILHGGNMDSLGLELTKILSLINSNT